MSADIDLSAVALVISLIALIIAVGQILQQYAATADGYRNCRKDVIGNWAKLTESPFDWRNLRFETRYVSPHISFAMPQDFYKSPTADLEKFDKILPIGHSGLPRRDIPNGGLSSARVSWLALLDHLWLYQLGLYYNAFDAVRAPAEDSQSAEKAQVRKLGLEAWFDELKASENRALSLPVASRTRVSWDFMPPDATKPFATISLHDLLVLGHRLCLDWVEVNPRNDRLTAQDDYANLYRPLAHGVEIDNGCFNDKDTEINVPTRLEILLIVVSLPGNDVSAHRLHGLGLMVHFQHDAGRSKLFMANDPDGDTSMAFRKDYLFVPSAEADKLAFGVIPGDTQLGLEDVHVAKAEHCVDYIRNLSRDTDKKETNAAELLERSFQQSQFRRSGFDQLMPLISPCLLLPGCKTTMVRRPNDWSHVGILEVMEGFVVFRERVEKMKRDEKTSQGCKETIDWIQTRWRHLKDSFMPFAWAAFREYADKAKLSTETSKTHHECTAELVTWTKRIPSQVAEWAHIRNETEQLARCRPMEALLRFHMLRAVALRERVEKSDLTRTETYGMTFPEAPLFCAMMHLMIDEIDELCKEVIRHLVGRERYESMIKEDIEFHHNLIDETRRAWLVWIFRALVFNRSAQFEEPRRSGAGGRPYNLIPANWLYSQIPVHIS